MGESDDVCRSTELRGVREYWIVDPDTQVVRVFRRQPDGALAAIVEFAHETVLTTPLLPGLEIRLSELFAH